jgi:hypothetical protein
MGNQACCAKQEQKGSDVEEPMITKVPAFELLDMVQEEPESLAVSANIIEEQTTAEGVGDHVCKVTGKEQAEIFTKMDMLKKLLDASGEELGRTFSLEPGALDSTQKKTVGGIACAVSDPAAEDCPLVYVSSGFEDLTGYTQDFTTGRNCRFLQPISKIINDAMNLDDRREMRAFCFDPQPNGKTIVNLLVNENAVTGERFWNLLRMQYIGLEDGHQYIFGVQTTIDAYMPKGLVKRLKISENNKKLVQTMEEFRGQLTRIRAELKKMMHAPIFEVKGYFTAMLNHIPMVVKLASNPEFAGSPPGSRSQSKATNGGGEEEALIEGQTVELLEDVKYASGALTKGQTGTVKSIDAFGNATIDFESSTRGILKRDLKKLKQVNK